MRLGGRPLSLVFPAACFAVLGFGYALVMGIAVIVIAVSLALSGAWPFGFVVNPAAWLVIPVSFLALGWAAIWIYLPLRSAWQLWRRIPGGLGMPRVLAWLAVAVAVLGVATHPRVPGQWLALALAVAVDICLYLPTTTRQFKATWMQLEGA